MPLPSGIPFHGEVNGNISAATEFTLYPSDGTLTPIVLGATQRVAIDNIVASTAATGTITIWDDQNDDDLLDAGELIVRINGTTGGGVTSRVGIDLGQRSHVCKAGQVPKVISTSIQPCRVVIRGNIVG